jgi:hypothetical protein
MASACSLAPTTPRQAVSTVTTDGNGGTFTMTAVNLTPRPTAARRLSEHLDLNRRGPALTAVTTAITQLATDRANVGANEERLNYTSDELGVLSDNLTAANSNLRTWTWASPEGGGSLARRPRCSSVEDPADILPPRALPPRQISRHAPHSYL